MCVYVNPVDDKKPIESNNKSHGLLIQNLRGFRLKLTILVYFKDNIHENYLYVKSYFKKEWDLEDPLCVDLDFNC